MENEAITVQIQDQQSLIHLGSLDSFDITKGGIQAARSILKYLDTGRLNYLRSAVRIYEELIPNENFGGEYSALEWLCRYFLAPDSAKEDLLTQPLPRSFYELLCGNGFDNLRYYLNNKYHIADDTTRERQEVKTRMRYLEDFILFINPDRERWETTRDNLRRCELKPGMEIADVGCGPGYYTFKFSDLVGETGRVYAIETNLRHLDFLHSYIDKNDVKNISVIPGNFEGIGLPPDVQVDVVFICSLYHNVYAAFTDDERDCFVGSIRRALRPGGKLIIVDNDLVAEQELPYHGPYISKQLITSQLWYYGFRLHDTFQFTPQRYVLIYDMAEPCAAEPASREGDIHSVMVRSAASLVRFRIIGTATSGYTRRGKLAGRTLYDGISNGDCALVERGAEAFRALWPQERIGDDYTAFLWFAEYYLADGQRRLEMTRDQMTEFYADYFCGNGFERLKTYLYYKFDLERDIPAGGTDHTNYEYDGRDFPLSKLNAWNEFLVFCNPNRQLWEKTEEMCAFFGIQPGQRVADLGCGGGFFSWYFSRAVGPEGKVYATEINDDALKYLDRFIQRAHVKNIKTIATRMNDTGLAENSVDVIFMCSMYHAVYITDIEFVKDAFIESLHKALRPGGRLIIVDNSISEPGQTPYYGSGISPELVIGQLSYYGFHLKDRFQVIPQRYALLFEEDADYAPRPQKSKNKSGRNPVERLVRGLQDGRNGPGGQGGPGGLGGRPD